MQYLGKVITLQCIHQILLVKIIGEQIFNTLKAGLSCCFEAIEKINLIEHH